MTTSKPRHHTLIHKENLNNIKGFFLLDPLRLLILSTNNIPAPRNFLGILSLKPNSERIILYEEIPELQLGNSANFF